MLRFAIGLSSQNKKKKTLMWRPEPTEKKRDVLEKFKSKLNEKKYSKISSFISICSFNIV